MQRPEQATLLGHAVTVLLLFPVLATNLPFALSDSAFMLLG